MRSISRKLEDVPVAPDTCNTVLVSGTAVAMDWPTDTQVARLTGLSSAGAQLNFYVNLQTTAAVVPTSGSSISSSLGVSIPVFGTREFLVGAASTGFGIVALSSGYVHVECWKR